MHKSILTGVLAFTVIAAQAQIFTDPMESAANWTVNGTADTSYTFGWDYSALGIPSAPNSGDSSTLGLRMAANIVSPTSVDQISAVVSGLSMSGSYTVSFDYWINANGPFPGGGGGSTEFIGGGVGMNNAVAGLDGASLIMSGEGGSSRDYRMYKGASEQFAESGQFAAGTSSAGGGAHNSSDPYYASFGNLAAPALQQADYGQQTGDIQAGAQGFAWHEMLISVNSVTGTARFEVDGLWIGTLDTSIGSAVDTAGGVGVIYADLFSSVSDNPDLSFGVIDNFVVIPEPTTAALALMGGLIFLARRRK